MLKKSASFVLTALGGSTYRTEYTSPPQPSPKRLRAGRSLAAAALDGLFDHPARVMAN
ncbi:MAG: hypothetical protein VST66_04625 [Nitrospirota bacterium]|nr:hypothetical protein [Nitrospirota bacterium]